jgi:quercetin dioxygenase-like cupin family protein
MDASAHAPRRIVTALNDEGLSYLARVEEMAVAPPPDDRPLDEVYPGWETGQIPEIRVAWGCDELPFRVPVDPALTPAGSHPGPLGVRVSVVTYPPGWRGEMFWSNRVDFLLVLIGELTYRTDAGDVVVARPGDVIVQHATNKAFENHGSGPMTFAAILFGADNAGPTPPPDQFHGRPDELPALRGGER